MDIQSLILIELKFRSKPRENIHICRSSTSAVLILPTQECGIAWVALFALILQQSQGTPTLCDMKCYQTLWEGLGIKLGELGNIPSFIPRPKFVGHLRNCKISSQTVSNLSLSLIGQEVRVQL